MKKTSYLCIVKLKQVLTTQTDNTAKARAPKG